MRRATAREFQKGFQRLEEPVLVNDGIWFPEATPELIAIAEGEVPPGKKSKSSGVTMSGAPVSVRPKLDLTKAAQAKGKMGHR